jgi:predicted RND superfamily exporter protein
MRERIEAVLEAFGHILYRRAWWVIVLVLVLVGLGLSQIPNLEVKTSADDFLLPGDPIRQTYDAFRDQFGRDDTMIIAVETRDVFDRDFLARLRDLHREIENDVPHLREVQSLVNARETRGDGDTLIVGELLEEWPEDAAAIVSVRERALGNPLYIDMLLSRDARLTALIIELEAYSEIFEGDAALQGFDDSEPAAEGSASDPTRLSGAQEADTVEILHEILARYEGPEFRIYAGGAPIINTILVDGMMSDVVNFTTLSIAVIALMLSLLFRRVSGVFVPLTVALLALLETIGLMGTLRIPAMPVSEVVPSFLLSVGVGGTVHLLVIAFQQLAQGADREQAIAHALGHSGLPIIMTSLTTAGGISSFAAANMQPIAIFGLVTAMGIMVTLCLTLTLAPALMSVIPIRAGSRDEAATAPPVASIRLLVRCGALATKQAGAVALGCVALLALAVPGILQLDFSHNTLDWFPDDYPVKVSTLKLDRDLGGGMALEVLVHSGKEDGLKNPELLRRVDRASRAISDLQVGDVRGGKTVSVVDIVKEIHQALDAGRAASRVIPTDPRLVSQELFLFENSGSDDLEDVVDTTFETGRITIKVPYVDGSQYVAFGEAVTEIFERNLGDLADTTVTGLMALMGGTFKAAVQTMARSYTIALVVIVPLMILTLGSLRLGLIAMIPNLFPIVLTLGLMGWIGIPLEMFSLLIGSIALGLAVDDTIHFMHGFRRSYARSGDVDHSVQTTLTTTGQALLFTSIVLSAGFAIFAFSALSNLQNFGLMTAFSICMAFLADILLAPALMKLTARYSSLASR